MSPIRLEWKHNGRSLEAVEPDRALLDRHAAQLRDWYNAAENAAMMDGAGDMTRDDVLDFWRGLRAAGGRGFLAFFDGEVVGDADLRRFGPARTAEFALMIGGAMHKGRGIGRALAQMIHVFAFRDLELERLYVPPRKDNTRVHALNAFLGYTRDDSSEARAFADSPDCETFSLCRETFRAKHPSPWREIVATDATTAGAPRT